MRNAICLLAATVLTASTAAAQITTFGGPPGDRKASSIFLYDSGAQKLVASYTITYGTPNWKAEYDKMVDAKQAGAMRLGKDGWTTLDTSVPLTIGGTMVPAGLWYLGLGSEGGKFSLMVLSAETVRKQNIPPWETGSAKAKINAPLTHKAVGDTADKLMISLAADKQNPTKGTFKLNWGNHELSAPIVVHVDAKTAEAAAKKKGFGSKIK